MDDLRLVLVLLGVVLMAGIYVWEVIRRRRRAAGPRRSGRARGGGPRGALDDRPAEPEGAGAETPISAETGHDGSTASISLGDLEQLVTAWDEREMAEPGPGWPDAPVDEGSSALPEPRLAAEPMTVAVTIMAKPGRRFTGMEIQGAMADLGFEMGEREIFHSDGAGDGGAKRPRFSVANVVEPGSFEPSGFERLETPGLFLFMQLPGPGSGTEAFDRMLETGRALAARLGGELRDDARSTLTAQAIDETRRRIATFMRKWSNQAR